MSTMELILTIVLAGIALGMIIFYVIKIIKNKLVGKIYDDITKAMKEAEIKFKDLSGKEKSEAKKKYVLEQVKITCKDLSIPYDFIAKLIAKVIENIVKGYNGMTK